MKFFSKIRLSLLKRIDGLHERWRITQTRVGSWFRKSGPGKLYSTVRNSFEDRLQKFELARRSGTSTARKAVDTLFLDSLGKFRDKLGLTVWRTSSKVKRSAWLERLLGALDFVISVAFSVVWYLGRWCFWTAVAFSFVWVAIEQRVAESKYFSWLAVFFKVVRKSVGLTAEFAEQWHRSRGYIKLILGTPAILVAIPLVYGLIRIPLRSDLALAGQYRQAAADAWDNEDFDAAKLYYRKISQLGVMQEAAVFESAILADNQGDTESAYQQMMELVETQDSPNAKLWLANKLMSDEIGFDDQERRLAVAEEFVDQLLAFDAENPIYRQAYAMLEFHRGKHDSAIEILRSIANDLPQALSTIAVIEQNRGNFAAATKVINEANDVYSSRSHYLTWQDSVHWARVRLYAGDWNGMMEAIQRGSENHADDKDFQNAAAELYGMAFDHLRRLNTNVEMQFRLMEHGITMQANRPEYLQRLALLADAGPKSQVALKLLQDNFSDDVLPATVQLILSRSAYLRNDFVDARRRLENLVSREPDNPTALNNLAWILANTKPIELDRALAYSTKAIKLMPDNPDFRETRGQIQVRLKRWEDAVKDLQFALNAQPNNSSIHTSLSVAYKGLGNPELSRVHADQASAVH